jgi:methylenetetrahydrofolate reductase (NADPH)
MKIIEYLKSSNKKAISFEIIPPIRGNSIEKTLDVIDSISKYNPPFIDITSHPASVEHIDVDGSVQKIIRRKRPGTLGICALIKHKFGIDAVPHVLCNGFSKQETEDFLIELSYIGIDNVLALRGDNTTKPKDKNGNIYAVDLVKQITELNVGIYQNSDSIGENTNFCIGIAGYPEKHIESPNKERDILWTKEKIKAGGDYIVTQMFFDNKYFWDFKNKISEVPVIPGIKIITNKKQLKSIPKTFQCEIPEELVKEIYSADDKFTEEIGVSWAAKQIEDLFNNDIDLVHLYIMQNSSSVHKLMEKIR